MKQWFYTLACVLLSATLAVAQEGINFFKGTFDEALVKATQEKKSVFIDFYATWCGPCKKMEKQVFTNSKVGEYFNQKFVSLKLDAERPENKPLAKQYKVEAFPTMTIIAPDGKLVSVITGYQDADELVRAAKTAMGDVLGVPQLYDKYRKDNKNLALQQELLSMARPFLMSQEGVEADKWVVRLNRLYKSYIKEKKGPALINKTDYIIIQSLGGDDAALKEEVIGFISDNLPAWLDAVGEAPAYYIVEHNDALIENLAKEGKASYQAHLEKIRNEYKAAYAVVPAVKLAPYDKAKMMADALYHLYKDRAAERYIQAMQGYFQQMGEDTKANEYAKVAQELYYAVGDKLPKEAHRQAIEWLGKALQDPEISLMDKINFITMMGDSEKALANYNQAKAFYNQAFAESLQLSDMEMVQAMIQGKLQMRLSELELLQK